MAELYEEHSPMVLAVCRGLLRGSVEAEDAAQQVFLSAQRALRNGSQPREPAAWLATIARNECIARVRARMREPLPSDAEPDASSPDSHAEAVRREHAAELRDAIGSLPSQQRDAIVLRELRGLSYEEVGATLELSPAAVESVLFRARRGLQLRLRGALAALSPVGWIEPVRELVGRLAAGGGAAAAPVAAKAVAVGVGAAVVAGGAVVVGPQVLAGPHAPPNSHPPHSRSAQVSAPVRTAAPPAQAAPSQPTPAAAEVPRSEHRQVATFAVSDARGGHTEHPDAAPEHDGGSGGGTARDREDGSEDGATVTRLAPAAQSVAPSAARSGGDATDVRSVAPSVAPAAARSAGDGSTQISREPAVREGGDEHSSGSPPRSGEGGDSGQGGGDD